MGKASRAKRERKQQPLVVVVRAGLATATSSTGPEQIKENS